MVDGQTMLGLTALITCTGIALQSLELAWNRRHLRDGCLFGWAQASATPAGLTAIQRSLHGYPGCLILLRLRAALAILCVLFSYRYPATWPLLAALVILQLYYNRRFSLTRENANAMYLYCLVACTVGALPGASARLVTVALVFLGFQVLLAYAMSGRTKLGSRPWRSGDYLTWVCQNRAAQLFPAPGNIAGRHRGMVLIATWGVILLELLFPLSVFLPAPFFWAFIAGGVMFHTAVSLTMGAHAFWWAFVGTYPALTFIHATLRAKGWVLG